MLKNIIFMGTPEFAVPSLRQLIMNGLTPVLVISQPDKPKGRNLVLEHTPVKEIALKNNIHVFQPEDINAPESINYIKSFKPDIIITVAYGHYLGATLRKICPYGAINLHPSLLPLHRGADPIRNTLLQGDEYCGVTVFFISAKMDSGQIIQQKEYKIADLHQNPNMTNLSQILADLGAKSIIDALHILTNKTLSFTALKKTFPEQNHEKATYSIKVTKDSTLADFSLSAKDFIHHVQAYAYEPGYYCYFRGKRLKIYVAAELASVLPIAIETVSVVAELASVLPNAIETVSVVAELASVHPNHKKNGTEASSAATDGRGKKNSVKITDIIKNKGFTITLRDADILIKEVQYEGKKKMSAWEFSLGARLQIGEILSSEL